MASYDYDLFVIGGGSGGVRAARIAAGLGARVGLCEERDLGGTCVTVGCVPKKLLVYGSMIAEELRDAAGYGWTVGEAAFDWPTLIANKNKEIERLNGVYGRMLEGAGVVVHEGRGVLIDGHTIEIGGARRLSADKILLAVGGWPMVPQIPGREHLITSNEAVFLPELPKRILIVGGGYIGAEFAGIFNGLGSRVTQIYRGPLFLRGFDDDVRAFVAEQMRGKGVDLRFDTDLVSVRPQEGALLATLSEGQALDVDCVLAATGRAPLTRNLGLEAAGVEVDARGAIVVDEEMRTSAPSIYAVGDVIDRVALTPVALGEGMALARNLFGGASGRVDYRDIPSAVFSQPNIGVVGLTEAQARAQYGDVTIFRSTFRPMKFTVSGRPERTLMKLVVDKASDRVVGVHMVGPDAGEIIQGLAVALKCGATKAQFDATIGIHPTAAEEFVTMRTPASS